MKSDSIPALFSGGGELDGRVGTGFWINKLDVVTTNIFLPAIKWREVPLSFPNRRGRQSAASGGHSMEPVHRAGDEQVMYL